jgi:hypothetical protein
MTSSVNWWAFALLMYLLCGFGFTIQGIQKLGPLLKQGWERLSRGHEKVQSRGDGVARRGWREEPSHQH